MNIRDSSRLHDTLDAAGKIQRWIAGSNSLAFAHDELLQSGIERQLEIIGESLRVVRNRYPEIEEDFPEIHGWIALRNIVAHEYQVVDYDAIWSACTQELPILVERLTNILDVS